MQSSGVALYTAMTPAKEKAVRPEVSGRGSSGVVNIKLKRDSATLQSSVKSKPGVKGSEVKTSSRSSKQLAQPRTSTPSYGNFEEKMASLEKLRPMTFTGQSTPDLGKEFKKKGPRLPAAELDQP